MIKKIAGVDLKRQFPYSSKGIVRKLFLTLAQVFKENIEEKIGNGVYGILTDEVTDISLTQQLVTFIQYYDSQSCTTTTSFLAISNTLKGNNSADAPQIKKVLLEQLQSVGLEVQTMRSFVSDSASLMTGARNGVAKLLKDENPLILSFHCLAHKLALACASSADTLDYIAHCELQLNQSWKLFDNSAKRTATYLKVQESTKNLTLNSAGRKQVAKKLKKACRTRWLSLDKSVEAVITDFCAIIEMLEQLKTEPTGSAVDDITDLPNESDLGFEDYGQAEIKITSNHFYGTKEEEEKKMKSAKLLAQWENFKFEMVDWKKQVPQTLLQPNDRSPEDTNILTTTDWTLQRLLARRKTYQDTYSELLMVAEAAWTMPLSNCWPERGGSAIKRIKTRMRSRLTDDMLNALMHVSINGLSFGTEECTDIVQRAAEIWLSAKNRRKPRSPKKSKVPEVESVSETRGSEGERLSGNESEEAVDEIEDHEVDADARTEEEVEIATAALGLREVDCDTGSDDSAFGSDLDE
ncbi:uncharacterized protein [Montipora capricornis]|uniref:uncharacterized protein n=1 Tax=Montipora capricornis TaxID=246305 RepID=UPI0035F15E66